MVQFKTSKERCEKRIEERKKKDEKVLAKFKENCKTYSISDAMVITADEFNISVVTLYNIRKRNNC
jgi:hypothetical protein